jgi:hypothetical protein
MYTFTLLVHQGAGAYSETVSHLSSLVDVKRDVCSALRVCRKQVLSAVLIIHDVQSGCEYWIDTYRGRVAAHWNTPIC